MQDRVREIALEVVRADGSRLPVLVNAALQRDPDGDPQVIRVVILDATERREYERELLRAKERAEEAEARASTLARTLQQTLIPPRPPEIPGLRLSAGYRPAGAGEEVGGDFYDVFQLDQDDWIVAIGDVCGKGVGAAVVTALIRHTLRAVTVRRRKPVDALLALNEVLLHHPAERFSTVAIARARRRDGRWRLTMSLAGHPPGVLLRPGQAAESVGLPGTLVGVVPRPELHRSVVVLDPGTTLVLYTDGVTEARGPSGFYGETRLRRAVEEHRGSPSLSDAILADVVAFQDGSPRDDIAVVAITVP
jgi:phosphoserine phosphatase RsbU/P